MRTILSGVSGALFPSRYVADRLTLDAGLPPAANAHAPLARQLWTWWRHVDATCGPATGIRAIFDIVAMPLFAILGFTAREVTFIGQEAIARLDTREGTAVGLVVSPWARRPPDALRGVLAAARQFDASWCFAVSPPYISIIDARSGWARRSIDFRFPHAFDSPAGITAFSALARASSFDESQTTHTSIAALVRAGQRFHERVGEDLQRGVYAALGALAPVVRHRSASDDERFNEALTLVYRVLFLLFAESRALVPCDHPVYGGAYTISSLCEGVLERNTPIGLWAGFAAITKLLRHGCRIEDLVVRPFNGRLFARASAPSLEREASSRSSTRATAGDAAIASVLLSLMTRQTDGGRDVISYSDLGVEQLGSVYERVLDVDPRELSTTLTTDARAKPPAIAPGHSARRKQSGTFYTPRSLTELVVRRTLAPLVADRSSDAILMLKVADPAMGSGAFLVAACRFLATAYERALVSEGRVAEHDVDDAERAHFRRLVARRCLYGVDRNPIAVQLAQLSLWLATLAREKPLSFLDHRLRSGNSLVGATPDDLRHVAPARRAGHMTPLFDVDVEQAVAGISAPLAAMARQPDESVADVRAKEALWSRLAGQTSPIHAWRAASDLWCARWFWPTSVAPSTAEIQAAIDALIRNDATLHARHLTTLLTGAQSSARRHGFFHWPLEFADVFYDEAGRPHPNPGFDAVVGNPPWEMLRTDHGGNGDAASLVRFVRESALYPSCDRGHVNLYQPFVDRALTLTRIGGRVGLVLPWGLATDEGAAPLRARLFDRSNTEFIAGLDNTNALFPVHRGLRFMVVVTSPGAPTKEIRTRSGLSTIAEIEQLDSENADADRSMAASRLTPALLERISGPTRRLPDIRRASDLDLLITLTSRYPPLASPEGWNAQFGRELNATEDRAYFGAQGLPVLDGKHIEPFRVLGGTGRRIPEADAARLLPQRRHEHARLGYRDVSGVANKFTLIAAIIPPRHVTTHTLFCLRTPLELAQQHFLCGVFNSFVMNLVARMLMGGHLTTSLVERLPVPVWRGTPEQLRIARLAERLAWLDSPRRATASAALQATVARMHGLDEVTFRGIVDAFPRVPEDQRQHAIRAFSHTDRSKEQANMKGMKA